MPYLTETEHSNLQQSIAQYEETARLLQSTSSDRLIEIIKLKQINAELLCSLKTIVELKESSEESFPSVYKIAKEIINRAEGRL